MHEALGMGRLIEYYLNGMAAKDDGAIYSIVVTDAAGNACEVQWDHDLGKWVMDDGVDTKRLLVRVTREASSS